MPFFLFLTFYFPFFLSFFFFFLSFLLPFFFNFFFFGWGGGGGAAGSSIQICNMYFGFAKIVATYLFFIVGRTSPFCHAVLRNFGSYSLCTKAAWLRGAFVEKRKEQCRYINKAGHGTWSTGHGERGTGSRAHRTFQGSTRFVDWYRLRC